MSSEKSILKSLRNHFNSISNMTELEIIKICEDKNQENNKIIVAKVMLLAIKNGYDPSGYCEHSLGHDGIGRTKYFDRNGNPR